MARRVPTVRRSRWRVASRSLIRLSLSWGARVSGSRRTARNSGRESSDVRFAQWVGAAAHRCMTPRAGRLVSDSRNGIPVCKFLPRDRVYIVIGSSPRPHRGRAAPTRRSAALRAPASPSSSTRTIPSNRDATRAAVASPRRGEWSPCRESLRAHERAQCRGRRRIL